MPLVRLRHRPEDDLVCEKGIKRTYTRSYWGISDNPGDDNLLIRNDAMCPKELSRDPFDPQAIIVSVRCKRRSVHSLKTWDITFTSTTEVDIQDLDRNSSPLDAPTIWSGDTVLYEVPITEDINGKLICNKAGDLFEGAMTQVVGWTFHAKKNIPYVSLDWIDDFVSGVNDATVTIRGKRCAEKTVFLRQAQIGEPRVDFGIVNCPSTFTFEYNPLGWYYEPYNRGYREVYDELVLDPKSAGGVTTVRRFFEIQDDKGRPVSTPEFLDERGQVYRVAGPDGSKIRKVPLDQADIIKLKFEVKKPVSFRKLGVLI